MSYPPTTLGEICDIVIGRTPSRGEAAYWGPGNKWVSISDLTARIITDTKEEITDLAVSAARCRRVSRGTLLYSFKLTIGKMAFAGIDLFTNEAIAALNIKDADSLNADYLYYSLQSAKVGGSNQAAKGATLNSKSLAEIHIPLPPPDDQIRIAQLLGRVERLIARRKQHLQQLGALLKSVFLEMFGDPVRNEKGWDKMPLENLGSINRGVSKHRPRNDPLLLGGNYPLIQTGEVSNAGIYITTYTQTYSDVGFAQSKMWPAGTLCITIAANIAQTGILTFDACFPDSVVGFVPHESESNVLYVSGLFWFFQAILEKNAPAAAQKNINLEILRGLEVPKPPIDLQNQFSANVSKVVALKSRYQQSLADLETLFAALSQSAFKGELDLSRVPLPALVITLPPAEVKATASDVTVVIGDSLAQYLPGFDYTAEKLASTKGLHALLDQWLPIWCNKLGSEEFSTQRFIEAAQYRLEELHPDAEFELGSAAQDLVKEWVFKALAEGTLSQTLDEASKRVQLKAAQA